MDFIDVKQLYEFCKKQIDCGKGNYKVWISTGGYYDNHLAHAFVDELNKEIILGTPE